MFSALFMMFSEHSMNNEYLFRLFSEHSMNEHCSFNEYLEFVGIIILPYVDGLIHLYHPLVVLFHKSFSDPQLDLNQ